MNGSAQGPKSRPPRPMWAAGSAEPKEADQYQIGPMIASGGSGCILQAEDLKLSRTVALKVLHFDAHADELMRRRFVREAEVLAMLAHPNIVPVYDLVWENGVPLFYSMKLVKGRTLQAILNDLQKGDRQTLQAYPLERLLHVFLKICDAVTFAHSKGVLHMDLKPGNVMVGEFGEVLVMDWGLAETLRCDRAKRFPEIGPKRQDQHKAALGGADGTPEFMSPEQAAGRRDEIDEQSDVYSLGGILFAILTLRPPGGGRDLPGMPENANYGRTGPPSLNQPAGCKPEVANGPDASAPHPVSAALTSVAMKALQFPKNQRYPSVPALAADIQSFQHGFATSAQNAGMLKQLELFMLRHLSVCLSIAGLLAGAAISNLLYPSAQRTRNRTRTR